MCSREFISKYKDAGGGESTYGMNHVALML
jgi:hypothetical protein